MGKKNLIFCAVFCVLALAATDVSAVRMLSEEDEALFWGTDETEPATVDNAVVELTEEVIDENGMVVKESNIPVPSRGRALHAVAVPEEINARAAEYLEEEEDDDPSVILLHADTPRSTMYPIGSEREMMERAKYEAYDPFLRKKLTKSPEQLAREAQIKAYKEAINDCVDSRKDQLDMEIGLLDYEDLFKTTAYLSETMSAIEQCYDNIGMDIIDELYDSDNEVLREYNRRTPTYRVKSTDVSFAPKYCKENCSVSAVAALQMEKFGEYKDYLLELLDNAPEAAKAEIPMVEDDIVVDNRQPADAVLLDTDRGYISTPTNGARPQAIRIRDANGKEQIVHWHPNGQAAATATPSRVVRAQRAVEDDVPYIDESGF